MASDYQVIVIGGGHAGYEAAQAAAMRGANTLLIAMDLDKLGLMSCNPAVGGLAKGQIVREIDALGGLIGKIADATAIQFRTLNLGRGPAVRATRTQNDRALFAVETKRRLMAVAGLTLLAGEVTGVSTKNGSVTGVTVRDRGGISAEAVIVACGTFLNGLAHIGMKSFPAGRDGDPPALGLTESLLALGISSARLKTGTPARLAGRTIDYSVFVEQQGDNPPPFFSLETAAPALPQRSCWLGHTSLQTKEIILNNLHQSPLFSGRIKGVGPRYCPSIEDKIKRFAHHDTHQVFIEPEGLDTDTVYVNGMSTSLSEEVQKMMIESVPGLENAEIEKYGYAIEYDFFPPIQLKHTLESKIVKGLYFAGQVNGTSGYEEAAAQGIVAGINASRKPGENDFILRRDQAYIGVLIDDLISRGTAEPYRMFTSRAEHRLKLRDDNALFRLTDIGCQIGLVSQERKSIVDTMKKQAGEVLATLRKTIINNAVRDRLKAGGIDIGGMNGNLEAACQRPKIDCGKMLNIMNIGTGLSNKVMTFVESEARYAGYVERENRLNDEAKDCERIKIPENFAFSQVKNISVEARQKLEKIAPKNLAQASRISGVSPADIRVLEIALNKSGKR